MSAQRYGALYRNGALYRTGTKIAPRMNKTERFLPIVLWAVALILVLAALYLGWRTVAAPELAGKPRSVDGRQQMVVPDVEDAVPGDSLSNASLELAEPVQPEQAEFIVRYSRLHTTIPTRPRQEIIEYVVQTGDSVFEIAAKFNIKPETVLWANYDLLNDNPDLISIGMALLIPPVDGVLYKWQPGDTLDSIAAQFNAALQDILNWPGNRVDLANPQFEPNTLVMLVGGHREFRQWLIPTIPRGAAGVSKAVYGAGACEGSYEGAYGTGTFVWPADNHTLSGNDYWSGHLGIDIAIGEGGRIYASDSGVVVFAGWSTGGYGNTIMIDHGNGYQTLYGHLSQVSVSCGRSVQQGGPIGYSGTTGNSTGPHLHFEVRYLGGFISPWFVLPAP